MKGSKTERRISLHDTMNRMAGRMDDLLRDHQRDNPTPKTTKSQELRFWIALDPVLADLHKNLVDARAHKARITVRHGEDAPMATVATDVVDSAKCAVETRLIELRRSEEAKAMVAAMVRKAQDERYRESVALVRARTNLFWAEFSQPKGVRPAEENAGNSVAIVLICIAALRAALEQAGQYLSVAAAFRAATERKPYSPMRLAGSG